MHEKGRFVELRRFFFLFRAEKRQGKDVPPCYNADMKGIFLLDTLMDALMIAMAFRLLGRSVRPVRLLAAALLGAAAAAGARQISLSGGGMILLWLATAFAMMAAAGGRKSLCRPIESTAALLASAGLLGGTVLALERAAGPLGLLLGTLAAAALAAAAFRKRRTAQNHVKVRILYRGHWIGFQALVDSGNGLRDYLTGRPVIVLPEAQRDSIGEAAFRPIFANTAGGRQMMWCFTPDQTQFFSDGKWRKVEAALAFSPGLGGDDPALFPTALL